MSDPTADLVVPTIVLVEAGSLYAKKRTSVDVSTVQHALMSARNCVAYPLDEQVVSLIPMELLGHGQKGQKETRRGR